MPKIRIDQLLIQKKLAASLKEATALLMARQVIVNQQPITTPGTLVNTEAHIELKKQKPYVSRGGYKLAAALDAFTITPSNLICADVGASTGGFTDVLLQQGAKRVYSIDVGYGDLAWKLRQDPRVVVMERTNARKINKLPEKIDLVVIDASFISLTKLLPVALNWTQTEANFITLIKPQFEAKKAWVKKGGVIKDKTIHAKIITQIITWTQTNNFTVVNLIASPITGPAGNKEFLLHLTTANLPAPNISSLVENCLKTLTY